VNASSSADRMVQVSGLVHRYGDLAAVNGISFDVERGEMFGLIGPDGAGKTTTLRVVLGLLGAHEGSVRTCGLDPAAARRAVAARVGYLSQKFSLYGDLSIDENIGFFAAVHGVKGWRERRDELLELLRLEKFRSRLAERLSGGMKQKLALACTLIHTPELLILDEPTTGVDPVSRRDFWKILTRLQREGLTIVLTTPYLDEAERCRRVALMDRGRFLALDDPELLRESAEGVTVEILARPRRRAAEILGAASGARDVQTFGERLHVTLSGVARQEAAAAAAGLANDLKGAGLQVESARPIVPSLEDVFIARIREAAARESAPREVRS